MTLQRNRNGTGSSLESGDEEQHRDSPKPQPMSLQSPTDLDAWQLRAINHVCQHPRSMLWLEMSGGKSIVWLTAISHLLHHKCTRGALILAPIRVLQTTWPDEVLTIPWIRHLRIAKLTGGENKKETRTQQLLAPADIYLCNFEQIKWLSEACFVHFFNQNRPLPFDFLVVDEVAKLKNARSVQGGVRFGYLRSLLPFFPRRSGGTGTPTAKGMHDLFGQYLCIDDGVRLGRSFHAFTATHFQNTSRDARWSKWKLLPGHREKIIDKIKDITFEVTPEERLKLPDYAWNDLWVDLPADAKNIYEDLEKKFFVEIDKGLQLQSLEGGAWRSFLQQIANGAVYKAPKSKEWALIHDTKLNILKDIVAHLQGAPLLLAYQYQHDAARIKQAFGSNVVHFTGSLTDQQVTAINANWGKGEIPILMGHAQSIGHGLNLQHGGHHICWFGCDAKTADFLQFNARLRRRNQKAAQVVIYRILARDTLDEPTIETLRRDIMNQGKDRNALSQQIQQYRARKYGI